MLNEQLSQELLKQIEVRKKECWLNSVRAGMFLHYDYTVHYVEGLVFTSGIPIDHGWLIVDNDIVDVTAQLWSGDKPQFEDYHPIHIYPFGDLDLAQPFPVYDNDRKVRQEFHQKFANIASM